ncbi:hypothetical protein FGO68_gene8461 [Halteria grandinella]|uniref:Sodefrin-like factor n=1 Tax=Halteria grandinella TaxID=5974 RepID=A0A8J8NEE6_HALGN|nr:hypothetical protein FGO68_gene8461 [Halteria grandinella]
MALRIIHKSLLLSIFIACFLGIGYSQDDGTVIVQDAFTSVEYGCGELGDLEMPDYCQACRGLYAGCKRCSVIKARPGFIIETYECLGCDEDMYLYSFIPTASVVKSYTLINKQTVAKSLSSNKGQPQTSTATTSAGTINIQTFAQSFCVHNCLQTDINQIAMPDTRKCQKTGHYCMYANHTHGCLQSYLPTNVTELAITSRSPTTIFMTSNMVISVTTGGPTNVSTPQSNRDRVESCKVVGMGITKAYVISALRLI